MTNQMPRHLSSMLYRDVFPEWMLHFITPEANSWSLTGKTTESNEMKKKWV
jgi:hypothetical protein